MPYVGRLHYFFRAAFPPKPDHLRLPTCRPPIDAYSFTASIYGNTRRHAMPDEINLHPDHDDQKLLAQVVAYYHRR